METKEVAGAKNEARVHAKEKAEAQPASTGGDKYTSDYSSEGDTNFSDASNAITCF
jgi:hypothetical protein